MFPQRIFRNHQLVKDQPCSLTKARQSSRIVKCLLNNSWEGLEKVSVLGEGHPAKEKGEGRRKTRTEHERK